MAANITINPSLTTNAIGSFNISTTGYIQGTALDSPNARFNLAGGQLVSTATQPLWGGSAIYEEIVSLTSYDTPSLGNMVGLATQATSTSGTQATSLPAISGFSVFDQDYAAINSPQSPVPLVYSGGSVHYYRLGSGARVAVQCDASVANLQGGTSGTGYVGAGAQPLYWDPVNQFLSSTAGNQTVSSVVYTAASGSVPAYFTVTLSSTWAAVKVGDVFSLSGVTANTGTAAYQLLNSQQTVYTVTDNEHFTFLAPTGFGTWGTISLSSGLIATNLTITGLVKVLDVSVGNCMTVNYNAYTGFAQWNRTGSCAIILI